MSDHVIALEDLYPPGGHLGGLHWAAAHRKGDVVAYATDEDRARVADAGWADKVAAPDTAEAVAAAEPIPTTDTEY